MVGAVHINAMDTQIEASCLFKIPKGAKIKQIEVYGVTMDSAVDDKTISYSDTFDA